MGKPIAIVIWLSVDCNILFCRRLVSSTNGMEYLLKIKLVTGIFLVFTSVSD